MPAMILIIHNMNLPNRDIVEIRGLVSATHNAVSEHTVEVGSEIVPKYLWEVPI